MRGIRTRSRRHKRRSRQPDNQVVSFFVCRRKGAYAMQRIVINKSCEEFCLSHKAFERLRKLGQREALQETDMGSYWPLAASTHEPRFNQCGKLIPRDDRKLTQVVEELGAEANGHCAFLKIVEIPDGVQWVIGKADGVEHISEVHRTWG